ncbi:amidohydrolase family protein [Bradyrhizobium sp. WSM471]|uniref:amidohydrolase family protein n=1 Tax=Bradyrhizobium sp. WSM471 TaxID=319017 RepID=UPI00024D1DC1|nr:MULTISPECIES: amidohydrolase family protein [Bradyrhizobium]EHR01066.1 putative TIM-barrel fold metal-dependent hydrolase [Bradyrhizobium sp. WSM471]UFW43125.1 amidohydrolase [Bradyrhizobium canariense]
MNNVVDQKNRKKMTIVDTDVHHGYRSKSDLFPYLSKFNAERFAEYGIETGFSFGFNGGVRGRRAELVDENNPPPKENFFTSAFDVEDTRVRLLDGSGIDLAILTGGIGQAASAMFDVDYASALCRAFNDFSLEHWIAKDERFRLALHINSQDPNGAAAEIDRLGSHPAVCSVMVGCGAPRPFGHRFYHPIYEACVRNGLAVAMHFGAEGTGVNPPISAAGFPSHYIEMRQIRSSWYSVNVASFVFEGVFEKFPSLKIGMLEAGFSWLAPLMWKMDFDWKGLRRQTPWVKKLPSQYIKEHIRFATQPMEEPEHPSQLKQIIDWIGGSQVLMFASDYPHWDWDDPARTLVDYPEDFRRRIFSENAIDTFRLSLPPISKAA